MYNIIVLAAGQGYELDGFNKLLIKNPKNGKTIIESFVNYFNEHNIIFVLGYRAINVMNQYHKQKYIYNPYWSSLRKSYSLNLALDEDIPSLIISGDLIIDKHLAHDLLNSKLKNFICSRSSENRDESSINIEINADSKKVSKIYKGKANSSFDQETVGIYKIESTRLLKKWKLNCAKFSNLFIAENLPLDIEEIDFYNVDKYEIKEINNPNDYIKLLGD